MKQYYGMRGPMVRQSNISLMSSDIWIDIDLNKAISGDLPFRTFGARVNGHVGIYDEKNGKPGAGHASPSRKTVVHDVIRGSLLDKLSKVRRLTIGDPKPEDIPAPTEAVSHAVQYFLMEAFSMLVKERAGRGPRR